MRLYSTITSERAQKHQGGNEKLVVDLYTGSSKESQHFATIYLTYEKDDGIGAYKLELIDSTGNARTQIYREADDTTKGKKPRH